eukprot:155468-Amphidinium_carterae.1
MFRRPSLASSAAAGVCCCSLLLLMLSIPIVSRVVVGTPTSDPTVDFIVVSRHSRSSCEVIVVDGKCLQFQQHLELKRTTQLTRSTSLEFLGKTIELMDNGTINLSLSQQYYNKILKAYNLEKCKPSTVPGNKKPPITVEPLDKEQHSMYRTARWTTTVAFSSIGVLRKTPSNTPSSTP